jgi:DNA-binding PadR family transcriptional regulator
MERDIESQLPLTSAMFHVLVALADGEKHGYAILKEVAARDRGQAELTTGTLYGIIKRLLNAGMIKESPSRPAPSRDDERRKYYRLTPFGRDVARAEARRLEGMLAAARATRLLKREA